MSAEQAKAPKLTPTRSPNAYIEATGLILLSASYFVVEVGTSTVSIAATSSIDSTTFAEVRFAAVALLR